MEFLAFITFTFCAVESPSQCVQVVTIAPTECARVGDGITRIAEAEGLTTDYRCEYTRAPSKSMRPVARPVERDS